MKSKSLSTVKYLLLLSLAIGLSSGYWYTKLAEQNSSLRSSVSTLQSKKQKAETSLSFFDEELIRDSAPIALDRALSETMLDIFNKRTEYRINIAQTKVANASGSSLSAEVGQFAENVPGTNLKSVKVSLTGSYTDYSSFLAYIAALRQAHPVSVVYLKVNDLGFEMSLRVFGTKN